MHIVYIFFGGQAVASPHAFEFCGSPILIIVHHSISNLSAIFYNVSTTKLYLLCRSTYKGQMKYSADTDY